MLGQLSTHVDADSHECPNCRGPGTAKAVYQHLGAHNPNEVRPRRRNHSRGAASTERPRFLPGAIPTSSESSFLEVDQDVQQVYMTTDAMADEAAVASQWPGVYDTEAAAASQGLTLDQWSDWLGSWSSMSPEDYTASQSQSTDNWIESAAAASNNIENVHIKQSSKIKTSDKNTIVVDLGCNINIIGCNTLKQFVAVSDAAGIPTSYVPRQNRLHVNGVGAGSATCDQEAIITIAVQFQDSTP